MQRFERADEPPPAVLSGPEASNARRVLVDFMRYGYEKRSQTNVPRSGLSLEDASMRAALHRLFRGRCAFCEANDSLSAYRFRPAAEALPAARSDQAHLYYAWLENAWENLYPICPSCQPSQWNWFPVTGARVGLPTDEALDRYAQEDLGLWRDYPIREKPVLLDPCEEKTLHAHLLPQVDGYLGGLSDRGVATIEHFNLNAQSRVQARRGRYAEYFAALTAGLTRYEFRHQADEVLEFDQLEFGGTWYLLLRRMAAALGPEFGARPIVSMARIDRFYAAMAGKRDTAERLEEAWQRVARNDDDAMTPRMAPARRQGSAHITGLRLTNFKAIEDLLITMPTPPQAGTPDGAARAVPSLLILGENSSGKSSILESVALALSDEAARQKLSLKPGNFMLNPAYLGAGDDQAPRQAEVEVLLSSGDFRRLTIDQRGMRDHGRPDAEVIPVFAYGAFRQYQHKQRPHSADKYIRNLFDGSVLSNPEKWLLGLSPTAYAMVMRALREILSIEGEFEVVRKDTVEQRCYMITAFAGPDGVQQFSRTPLGAVSSGFRSVLAMACDIMQGLMDSRVYAGFESLATARGVVLIDEVEAHLHPRWKMQIMRGLRRALPQMTFIATTHDPLCLRGMEDNEVVVLQRVSSSGSPSSTDLPMLVETLVNLPPISELRIEQLLTSDFFQLYSTDAPEMEAQLAHIGDLLAKDADSLSPAEKTAVDNFRKDIAQALPIGASEAHRLVQEAVAEYLVERRAAAQQRMASLRDSAKRRIVDALRGI